MGKATGKKNGLSTRELSSFCDQIAMMLESGMTLRDGVAMLAEDEPADGVHPYRDLQETVEETGSLYEAMKADEAGNWPQYMTEMVGIGEETGRLEDIMRNLSHYYQREGRIRDAASSALTYPLILGAMLVVIVLILLWRVLPVFRRVLESMGVSSGETGTMFMSIGAVAGWVVLVLIVLLAVAVITCVILMKTSMREKVRALLMKLFPPMKRINEKLSASRVAGMLSLMLSGGFPVETALEMAPAALTDPDAVKKLEAMRGKMDEGATFTEALNESKLFTDFHNRMIKVGAASGHEPQVMEKVAGLYEEQVEEGLNRLVAIIEPTLVALLCIVIGAILLSVMMPMAGILGSL